MAKFTIDIPAGPIWNQEDAEKKCPMVCAARFGNCESGCLSLR